MKKATKAAPELAVTSVKVDADLWDKAHSVARKNKRAGNEDLDAAYKILNAALALYLKGK